MNVTVDATQLNALASRLAGIRNGAAKAINGAINDTLKRMKTRVNKRIRKKVALNAKDVRPYIAIKRSTTSTLSGVLHPERTRRIGLIKFGAKQTKAGVTYKIEKKGKRKLIAGAFIAGGDAKWVAIRTTKARRPLIFPQGVSAYGVFARGGVRAEELRLAPKDLHKNIERRVKLLLLLSKGKLKNTAGRAKALA